MPSHRNPARPPPIERRRAGHDSRYDGPERRTGRGRSGYGMDSIRRYLRAQLELHSLLRPSFPPSDDDPGAQFGGRRVSHGRHA